MLPYSVDLLRTLFNFEQIRTSSQGHYSPQQFRIGTEERHYRGKKAIPFFRLTLIPRSVASLQELSWVDRKESPDCTPVGMALRS